MTEQKFPVGRYAEKANGDRRFIVAVSHDHRYPIITYDNDHEIYTYTSDGKYTFYQSSSYDDLVTLLPPECDSFDWEPADEDDEPSCPAVDVLETHRVLEVGEVLQDGDEYLAFGTWVPTRYPGIPIQDAETFRRPLPTVQLFVETTRAAWDALDDKWDVETTSPAKLLVHVGVVPGGKLFFLAD